MVAAKASLSIRVDALAETDDADLGTLQRGYLEQKCKELESIDVSILLKTVFFWD